VPALRERALERNAVRLEERVEAHRAESDGALALGGVPRVRHARGRRRDVLLEHIVEEAKQVLDEERLPAPLVPGLEVNGREAADRRARLAVVVSPRRQQDLAAEIRLAHGEPELALMLRQSAVRGVDEEQIRLARLQAGLEDLLPEQTGGDRLQRR